MRIVRNIIVLALFVALVGGIISCGDDSNDMAGTIADVTDAHEESDTFHSDNSSDDPSPDINHADSEADVSESDSHPDDTGPDQPEGCGIPSNGCDSCGKAVCPAETTLDSSCKCITADYNIVAPVSQSCDFCCGKTCEAGEFLDFECTCYSAPKNDHWEGCPQERQCLSGDIMNDDAKICCPEGQKCVTAENPEEGGSCQPEECDIPCICDYVLSVCGVITQDECEIGCAMDPLECKACAQCLKLLDHTPTCEDMKSGPCAYSC